MPSVKRIQLEKALMLMDEFPQDDYSFRTEGGHPARVEIGVIDKPYIYAVIDPYRDVRYFGYRNKHPRGLGIEAFEIEKPGEVN